MTLTNQNLLPTNQIMYIAKERCLLDKDCRVVKDGDPKGVRVFAGFKGAVVSEKEMAKVKGAEHFFEADNLTKGKSALKKRVLGEAEPAHTNPPVVKGK